MPIDFRFPKASHGVPLAGSALLALCALSCTGKAYRPCSDGGDPAREKAFRGTKQCRQVKNSSGQYVNQGVYREWYPSGKLALEGEYEAGRKQGRWAEYAEDGKRVSEKWFEDGLEVPPRESTPGVRPSPEPKRAEPVVPGS